MAAVQQLRYALPGLSLAILGLPFYIYVPLWLAEEGGYGYGAIGAIFFAARLGDIATDLPVGSIADRGSGHRLPLLGWLLLVASAAVLIGAPHPWHSGLLVLALVVLMLAWSFITIPWLALPVLLSKNRDERLAYNSSREGMLLFGTLIAMLAPGIFDANTLRVALAGMLGFLLLSLLGLPSAPKGRSALTSSYRQLLADPRVRHLAGPWFINMLANAIPGTVLVLFMREVLGAEALIPLALLSYFAAGFLAMPIWYAVARRCGRLWSWRLGLLLSAVLFSLGLGLGDGDGYWFIAISIGTGMMLGADQAIPSTMQTTLAQRLMAEQPNTAVAARLFALWSMLNKAAMGLAVGVAYLWLGTQQTGVGTPPPEWAICAAYIVAPVVLKLLVFVLLGRPQMAYLGHEDGGDV